MGRWLASLFGQGARDRRRADDADGPAAVAALLVEHGQCECGGRPCLVCISGPEVIVRCDACSSLRRKPARGRRRVPQDGPAPARQGEI